MKNTEQVFLVSGYVTVEGKPVNVYETKDSAKALARVSIDHDTGLTKYHIKFKDNRMANYLQGTAFRSVECKWNLVREDCFTSYCHFLKTGSMRHLTHAEKLYNENR